MASDEDVSDELLNEYAPRLARVAERQLDRRLSSRLAPEDIVQSVFRTFFRRKQNGTIQIDSSLHLWRLLARITVMKCRARARQHTAAQRDVAAEACFDSSSDISSDSCEQAATDLLDLIESVSRELPDWYADALNLRLQGNSVAEVAAQTKRSQQSVYRALHVLHDRLSDRLD